LLHIFYTLILQQQKADSVYIQIGVTFLLKPLFSHTHENVDTCKQHAKHSLIISKRNFLIIRQTTEKVPKSNDGGEDLG